MLKSSDRIIDDAKRAARRLARTRSETYQSCLDLVARDAGRAHWKAFLVDPVDLRAPSPSGDPSDTSPDRADFVVNDPLPDIHGAIARSHGGSSFATESRTAQPGPGNGEGIVLGVLGMPDGESRTLRSARSSIVLCVGEPGTGKTMGVLMPTIADSPDASVLIHDPKPEILSAIEALGLRKGSTLVVLDPLNASSNRIERIAFNPLHQAFRLPNETLHAHALRIAIVMMPPENSIISDYVRKGRDVLTGIIAYLMRHPDEIPSDGRSTRCVASLPAVDDWLTLAHSGGISETFDRAATKTMGDDDMVDTHAAFSMLASMSSYDAAAVVGAVGRGLLQTRNVQVRAYLDPTDARSGAAVVDALADASRPTTAIIMNDQRNAPAVSKLTALAMEMIGRWRATRGSSTRSLQILVDEANKIEPVPWIGDVMRDGPPPGTAILLVAQNPERLRLSPEHGPEGTNPLRVQHVVDMRHASADGDLLLGRLLGRNTVTLNPHRRSGTQRLVDAGCSCELRTPFLFPPRPK